MSLLLRLAALTAFRLPQAAAELCGNRDFDLDTCVSTEEPCGQLPANTDHLTLIGVSGIISSSPLGAVKVKHASIQIYPNLNP